MYKVGIIGLGHIAAFYGKPEEQAPYCHAGGIYHSTRVQLTAIADPSDAAEEKFCDIWGDIYPGLRYYSDTEAMLHREDFDIVAVCVRGPLHQEIMMLALANSPRAVFLEKPPSCSLSDMDKMVALAQREKIPIVVSYSRHWSPHILRLRQLVREGLIGDVQSVTGYTGGLVLSYASHTTDLICQFAGYDAVSVTATGKPKGEAPEGYESEPELTRMEIEFSSGITGVQIGAEGEHGSFYCDVIGTKGTVRAGMYIPPAAFHLSGEPIDLTGEMPEDKSVFTVAYDQIADYLDGGALPDCANQDFIMVNEIGFGAIESMHGGAAVALPNKNRARRIFANG